jgi:hypothetical protein
MNNKKAKYLRKLALSITDGFKPTTYITKVVGRKEVQTGIVDTNGLPQVVTINTVEARLDSTCTRAVYKKLKRGSKCVR